MFKKNKRSLFVKICLEDMPRSLSESLSEASLWGWLMSRLRLIAKYLIAEYIDKSQMGPLKQNEGFWLDWELNNGTKAEVLADHKKTRSSRNKDLCDSMAR